VTVPSRRTDLAERLAPHLPRRYGPETYGWWSPPDRWRASGKGPRVAHVVQVLDHLALLHGLGHDLAGAVEVVVANGRGPAVAELAGVAAALATGTPAADALRAWGRRSACPHVAQLAADLRTCIDADAATAAIRQHAERLRCRAWDQRLRALRRRAWVVVAASLLVGVATTLRVVV